MCEFFSCIITRTGDILFCETDSHEDIINRAKLDDIKLTNRNFVRIENKPTKDGWEYIVDEDETLPRWYRKREEYFIDKVTELSEKVQPAMEEYLKIQQSAMEEYLKIEQPVWEEYLKIKQSAWEEYIKEIKIIEGYVGA